MRYNCRNTIKRKLIKIIISDGGCEDTECRLCPLDPFCDNYDETPLTDELTLEEAKRRLKIIQTEEAIEKLLI